MGNEWLRYMGRNTPVGPEGTGDRIIPRRDMSKILPKYYMMDLMEQLDASASLNYLALGQQQESLDMNKMLPRGSLKRPDNLNNLYKPQEENLINQYQYNRRWKLFKLLEQMEMERQLGPGWPRRNSWGM